MKLTRAFFLGCIFIFGLLFILEALTNLGPAVSCRYEYSPHSIEAPRDAWHSRILRMNMPEFFPVVDTFPFFDLKLQSVYANSSSAIGLWTVQFEASVASEVNLIKKFPTELIKYINLAAKVLLGTMILLCFACFCSSIFCCVTQQQYEKINGSLFVSHWVFMAAGASCYTSYCLQNLIDTDLQCEIGYGLYVVWTAFIFSLVAFIFLGCILTAFMENFEEDYLFSTKQVQVKKKRNKNNVGKPKGAKQKTKLEKESEKNGKKCQNGDTKDIKMDFKSCSLEQTCKKVDKEPKKQLKRKYSWDTVSSNKVTSEVNSEACDNNRESDVKR